MGSNSVEKRILDAALDVVSENSISNTRMHLIADKARMVQSNVHYYFKTKRELMMALLKKMHQNFWELRHNVVDCQAEGLQNKLIGFYSQKKDLIINQAKYDRAQFDFWCQGQSDPEINRLFAASYSDWRAHICRVLVEWEPELTPERANLIASSMVSLMMGASLQYLNNPDAFDLDDYFELCLEMTMKILGEEMAPLESKPAFDGRASDKWSETEI
ncbi:TetR/AcrR family transcriptional regulator [Ruminococcaceae bacterium OttesenSCG-928-A11]|nr:TetR/AcrR family transcriptional regulator [Ruminococcaceae bacterium OttesenSCG-928-A11]